MNDDGSLNVEITFKVHRLWKNRAEIRAVSGGRGVNVSAAELAQKTFEQEQIPGITIDGREARKTRDVAQRNYFPLHERIQSGVNAGDVEVNQLIFDEQIFIHASHGFVSDVQSNAGSRVEIFGKGEKFFDGQFVMSGDKIPDDIDSPGRISFDDGTFFEKFLAAFDKVAEKNFR